MKRSDAMLKDSLTATRRRELRAQLFSLVRAFGYTAVKNELLAVKRTVEEQKIGELPGIAQPDVDRFQELLILWTNVEKKRRAMPGLSGREACEAIAREGGVSFLASGRPPLNLGPAVSRQIVNSETIYREWKRANGERAALEAIRPGLWDQMAGPGLDPSQRGKRSNK